MAGCISEQELLIAARTNIINTAVDSRGTVVRAYRALGVFSESFLTRCVLEANDKDVRDRDGFDEEETYYQVERLFHDHGHPISALDDALDEDDEAAHEFLRRVAEGEDAMQLASEYEFIEE